jgi:ribosome-binding protein aMBF1 (putative translation factor)
MDTDDRRGPRTGRKGRAMTDVFSDSAKLSTVLSERDMKADQWISPIGQSIDDHIAEQERLDPEYRKEAEENRHLAELMGLVLIRRTELGITQKELAERMGTSHSVISRIESGRHQVSLATLRRLARALDVKLVFGFEMGKTDGESEVSRSLVVVP